MKANPVQHSVNLKVFLGILLMTCFFATAAHADSRFTGTFTLTHTVQWGSATLSPGTYSLALDEASRTGTIIIRNAQTGKIVAREGAQGDYGTAGNTSEIVVTVQGTQRAVSSVQLAGVGQVFQRAYPFAASRRAAEEARNTEAVPVQLAKK
jgi:hypothetical protein